MIDFKEGTIEFQPTYKFIKGTQDYTPNLREKTREPAWCDRILWRGDAGIIFYSCALDVSLSDHKPVFALFTTPTKSADLERKEQIKQEIYEQINLL